MSKQVFKQIAPRLLVLIVLAAVAHTVKPFSRANVAAYLRNTASSFSFLLPEAAVTEVEQLNLLAAALGKAGKRQVERLHILPEAVQTDWAPNDQREMAAAATEVVASCLPRTAARRALWARNSFERGRATQGALMAPLPLLAAPVLANSLSLSLPLLAPQARTQEASPSSWSDSEPSASAQTLSDQAIGVQPASDKKAEPAFLFVLPSGPPPACETGKSVIGKPESEQEMAWRVSRSERSHWLIIQEVRRVRTAQNQPQPAAQCPYLFSGSKRS